MQQHVAECQQVNYLNMHVMKVANLANSFAKVTATVVDIFTDSPARQNLSQMVEVEQALRG